MTSVQFRDSNDSQYIYRRLGIITEWFRDIELQRFLIAYSKNDMDENDRDPKSGVTNRFVSEG